ncbi:MAG: type II secretion system F family protein [Acidimicrobiia bacterium]
MPALQLRAPKKPGGTRPVRKGQARTTGESTFAYRAIDASGAPARGTVPAETKAIAIDRLRRQGLIPVSVTPQRKSILQTNIGGGKGRRGKRSAAGEVAVATRQIATMVNAGVPILRALTIAAEQSGESVIGNTFQAVRRDIEKGDSLSVALGRHPKLFDEFYVSMVGSGERGGQLDQVLLRVAIAMEKSAATRRKVKSALAYPAAVGAMAVLIITAMLLFLVPVFQNIFKDLNGTLPIPTRILIVISTLLRHYFPFVLLVTVATFTFIRRWKKTEKGKLVVDSAKIKIPIVGKLLHKAVLARFSRTLGVLLRAGIPVLEALQITSRTLQNALLQRGVANTIEQVRVGETLAATLADQKGFPPMLTQMVAVGEEAGEVDTLLDKAADFYESEVETAVEALTSMLEPVLLVFLGLTVGGMVVALYLPMFQMIDLVK